MKVTAKTETKVVGVVVELSFEEAKDIERFIDATDVYEVQKTSIKYFKQCTIYNLYDAIKAQNSQMPNQAQ